MSKVVFTGITTAAGAQTAIRLGKGVRTFMIASSAGTTSATVLLQGSNDNTSFETMATATLSGASDVAGVGLDVPWPYVRGNISAIAGATPSLECLVEE